MQFGIKYEGLLLIAILCQVLIRDFGVTFKYIVKLRDNRVFLNQSRSEQIPLGKIISLDNTPGAKQY